MPGSRRSLLLAVALATSVPQGALAQGFAGWVGLHRAERLAWLENENRIGELCANVQDVDACLEDVLRPAVDVFPLHVGPDAASARVGDLIVIAVPGWGLSAQFRPAAGGETVPLTPDVFLRDWGYGQPYFHQTFTGRTGTWFQLPPDPWGGPVWLDRASESDPSILEVQAGDILELQGRGMYVVSATVDALGLRPEQPADMWCQEGQPPPLVPAEPTMHLRAELVDDRGHLMIRPKYMKGC